ncbi:response regulator transcription factor [Herbivorax sp. ANBcel31]|uniref:response regulator transcription factor n=1 Tax=Herbivorax sp. ANBcel31 TaxID=3069754 RepID=UPI0027B4EA1B|nr:response regulator transcription factor [Herbivorax sp. ANBcel31]MDQ2085038.1 response regulator transcription factor [Herbivorax sp. ANBcel31]
MIINVLIVDDDQLLRENLKLILDLENDINVIFDCKNGDEAYKLVIKHPEIDVILMDIKMPVCNGIIATKKILEFKPEMKILVLTTFDDDKYIYEALKQGAKGYVLKNSYPEKIISALKTVFSGNILVGENAATKLPNLLNSPDEISFDKYFLSDTEIEIIKHIAKGMTNREIADSLFLTEGTIKNKISTILNKLNLRDRTQIAVFYYNNGNANNF